MSNESDNLDTASEVEGLPTWPQLTDAARASVYAIGISLLVIIIGWKAFKVPCCCISELQEDEEAQDEKRSRFRKKLDTMRYFSVLWPFKMLTVLFHELSHAIVGMLTGGKVAYIRVDMYEGGETGFYPPPDKQPVLKPTLAAGYLGSCLFGCGLLGAGFDALASKYAALALFAYLLLSFVICASIRSKYAFDHHRSLIRNLWRRSTDLIGCSHAEHDWEDDSDHEFDEWDCLHALLYVTEDMNGLQRLKTFLESTKNLSEEDWTVGKSETFTKLSKGFRDSCAGWDHENEARGIPEVKKLYGSKCRKMDSFTIQVTKFWRSKDINQCLVRTEKHHSKLKDKVIKPLQERLEGVYQEKMVSLDLICLVATIILLGFILPSWYFADSIALRFVILFIGLMSAIYAVMDVWIDGVKNKHEGGSDAHVYATLKEQMPGRKKNMGREEYEEMLGVWEKSIGRRTKYLAYGSLALQISAIIITVLVALTLVKTTTAEQALKSRTFLPTPNHFKAADLLEQAKNGGDTISDGVEWVQGKINDSS